MNVTPVLLFRKGLFIAVRHDNGWWLAQLYTHIFGGTKSKKVICNFYCLIDRTDSLERCEDSTIDHIIVLKIFSNQKKLLSKVLKMKC